ncbi:hypothetical protein AEQU3_02856 [Aequorivita antarctica]|nr:hypothetical protein AEQU3_02856 [Aequorivita antarctica]
MEISREILTRVTILDISLILMYIVGIVALARKFRSVSIKFVRLFTLIGALHLLFTFLYYYLTLDNVADAIGYYRRVIYLYDSWNETFGQGTTFIYFTLYPLVKFFGLSYFGAYFIYSFLGLLGFYYLLNVLINITDKNWSNWFYILLLPNAHYWTVGIGKDSLMFFGISFLVYLYFFRKKWFLYIFPLLLVAFIRLHTLFFILTAFGATQILLNKKIKISTKILVFVFLGGILFMLFPFLMARVGFVDTESILSQFEDLAGQKIEGGSSIYMGDKTLIVKWLSYMFRPLFYDVFNILSLIVSFENALWLIFFFKIFKNLRKKIQLKYQEVYWFTFSAVFFITIPAAYLLYNLGIAVRQKTMIIPFLFILVFLSIFRLKKNI